VKTTIELPDELLREVKQYAVRHGVPMRAVFERGLRMAIAAHPSQGESFHLKTITTEGEGLVCEDNWQTIRSLAYEGHGG